VTSSSSKRARDGCYYLAMSCPAFVSEYRPRAQNLYIVCGVFPAKRARRIPRMQRIDVTRAEFNRVIDLLNERGQILNDLRHNQDVQFRRIAQLQAELDRLACVGSDEAA